MLKELKPNRIRGIKKQIFITATVLFPLKEGTPAVYLYRGKRYRTAAVQRILKTTSDYVIFETKHCIYTIHFDNPAESKGLAA